MSKVWYGNLTNRLEENKMFCDEIKVGMGMTEYSYSDRDAYEVIEVKDQKHVVVRELDHKLIGGAYSNDWELTSNENNPTRYLTKRGNYWYWTNVIDKSILNGFDDKDNDGKFEIMLYLAHNNTNVDELNKKGKVTRYYRANVSFGKANYYYDYSF